MQVISCNAIFSFTLLFISFSVFSTLKAENQNTMFARLERGEVITSKEGAMFVVQALAKANPEDIKASLFKDLKKLPSLFPQIAFVHPYVTIVEETQSVPVQPLIGGAGIGGAGIQRVAPSTMIVKKERHLVYLKLRGLGDGVGVLMEVKEGAQESFANAMELMHSGSLQFRQTEFDKPINQNQGLNLIKETGASSKKEEIGRNIFLEKKLTLEGPLNSVMEFPGLRIAIHLAVGRYMTTPSPGKVDVSTYLIAKVLFGTQVPKQGIGDYRGFGEQKLSLAQRVGVNVLRGLTSVLERGQNSPF